MREISFGSSSLREKLPSDPFGECPKGTLPFGERALAESLGIATREEGSFSEGSLSERLASRIRRKGGSPLLLRRDYFGVPNLSVLPRSFPSDSALLSSPSVAKQGRDSRFSLRDSGFAEPFGFSAEGSFAFLRNPEGDLSLPSEQSGLGREATKQAKEGAK